MSRSIRKYPLSHSHTTKWSKVRKKLSNKSRRVTESNLLVLSNPEEIISELLPNQEPNIKEKRDLYDPQEAYYNRRPLFFKDDLYPEVEGYDPYQDSKRMHGNVSPFLKMPLTKKFQQRVNHKRYSK